MGSLISDSDKSDIEKVIDSMHDTFAREIYAYKEAKKVIISSSSFHGLYSNVNGEQQTENVPQFQTFKARIYYPDRQREDSVGGDVDMQIKVERPQGEVRIKIDQDGYNYIKDAKRVEFDGRRFIINRDVRPHGLFAPKYYTLYLKPVDFE